MTARMKPTSAPSIERRPLTDWLWTTSRGDMRASLPSAGPEGKGSGRKYQSGGGPDLDERLIDAQGAKLQGGLQRAGNGTRPRKQRSWPS